MKLSMLAIQKLPECSRIPWWMRVAWWDIPYHQAIVLPIGIHWIARQARNLWLWTFRYRGSRWEQELLTAEARGRKDGFAQGIDTAATRLAQMYEHSGLNSDTCRAVARDVLFPELRDDQATLPEETT
jgi:hypothetical protein